MNIGFTGTKKGMTNPQRDAVMRLVKRLYPDEAHHGQCVGADAQFHDICLELGIHVVLHPGHPKGSPDDTSNRAKCEGARWVLDAKDYMARNEDIAAASRVLIVAPDGMREKLRSGTWATARRGRKSGTCHVFVVWPDGTTLRPCVQCGFCCMQGPCGYGEWDPVRHRCKDLTEDNKCGRYGAIVASECGPGIRYPMFGSGCSSSLFNDMRAKKLLGG